MIAIVRKLLQPNCKIAHFPIHALQHTFRILVFLGKIRDQRIIRSGRVANTPTYPVMCPFHFLLCDHNSPSLQTTRRMDGRDARSISAKCIWHVALKSGQFFVQWYREAIWATQLINEQFIESKVGKDYCCKIKLLKCRIRSTLAAFNFIHDSLLSTTIAVVSMRPLKKLLLLCNWLSAERRRG